MLCFSFSFFPSFLFALISAAVICQTQYQYSVKSAAVCLILPLVFVCCIANAITISLTAQNIRNKEGCFGLHGVAALQYTDPCLCHCLIRTLPAFLKMCNAKAILFVFFPSHYSSLSIPRTLSSYIYQKLTRSPFTLVPPCSASSQMCHEQPCSRRGVLPSLLKNSS